MSTAAGIPHEGGAPLPQGRTRSINAGACPMRVQTARFARSNRVIPMVFRVCSTVQETAPLVVASRRRAVPVNRAGAQARGYLERA